MKCENLKAYLDNELRFSDRLVMRAHIKLCPTCRQNMADWSGLSRDIERLEGEPVPTALKDKLLADAMTTAASARTQPISPAFERPRAREVWQMKRAFYAAALAMLIVAVGLWLLPGQEDGSAIASMARAMAKVKSVHFIGYALDENGQRRNLEGWIKGENRIRIHVDGKADIADDGRRLIAVELGRLPKVTVRNSGDLPGLAEGMTYLDLFSGPGALKSAIQANGAEIIGTKETVLENGRKGLVTVLRGDSGAKMRIYTDAETYLLARSETYDRSGKLAEVIRQVSYDVPVADSAFKLSTSKDLPVLDMVSPSSDRMERNRNAEFERLQKDPNACMLLSVGNGGADYHSFCAGEFHPGVQFEVFGPGFISVHYLADKNVYRILGKGRAVSFDGWKSDFVEDGDIRVPGEPQIEEAHMLNGRVGAFCGKGRAGVYRFVNVGPGPATITYHRVRKVFLVRGTAQVLPTGEVYSNQAVKLDTEDGQDLVRYLEGGGKLVWGSLPQEEIASMKADLDVALRLARVYADGNRIDGEHVAMSMEEGSQNGIRFERAGPGTRMRVLGTPSTREFHIIGRAHIMPQDRIVKNGIVSFDGEVVSSEE